MSEQGKKKAVAPVLQNMQDYISNHYMDELLDEVCAGIELGIVENLEIDVGNGKVVVDRNDSKIVRTDLWWKDRTHLLADIRMRTKIGLSQDSGIPRYYVRYINFSTEFTLDGGITLHPGIQRDYKSYLRMLRKQWIGIPYVHPSFSPRQPHFCFAYQQL